MSLIRHYNSEDKVLVAVDSVIFGFDREGLKILLIKRDFEPQKGAWSLMGGFLKKNETLDQAANRVLHELTGLDSIYMEQYPPIARWGEILLNGQFQSHFLL